MKARKTLENIKKNFINQKYLNLLDKSKILNKLV